jgi:SAM-dependent methyltransferase
MGPGTRGGASFEGSYAGIPPWDIGRPQKAIVALAAEGKVRGSVLDVGCGTGEHVLYLASRGHDAWGIDTSKVAIAKAETKARERSVSGAVFRVADAMDLGALGRTFDTVIDSGVFHVFSDADRARYVRSLGDVLARGGMYATLVFADREPTDWGGPRRIAAAEFTRAFHDGWAMRELREARFETNLPHHVRGGGGHAWLAIFDRL